MKPELNRNPGKRFSRASLYKGFQPVEPVQAPAPPAKPPLPKATGNRRLLFTQQEQQKGTE